jgi:hypothetical protein
MLTGWLTQARWSVLGPQPTGEPRTTAGRSGHPTSVRTAGSSSYRPLTSNGGEGCSGVRVSPPGCREPLRALAHEAVVTEVSLTRRPVEHLPSGGLLMAEMAQVRVLAHWRLPVESSVEPLPPGLPDVLVGGRIGRLAGSVTV